MTDKVTQADREAAKPLITHFNMRVAVAQVTINAFASHRIASTAKLEAERDELLRGMRELAIAAHEHWDANEDFKVGKIIMALAGRNAGYDERADRIDTLLGN